MRFIFRFFRRIKNSIFWARKGWNTYDWDFDCALEVFYTQTVLVRKGIEKYNNLVNYKKKLRRMREFEGFLQRLLKDDYYSLAEKGSDWGIEKTEEYYKRCEFLRGQDCEFIGLYLKKYSQGWWD